MKSKWLKVTEIFDLNKLIREQSASGQRKKQLTIF